MLCVIALGIATIIVLKHNHHSNHHAPNLLERSKGESALKDSKDVGEKPAEGQSNPPDEDFVNYNVHAFYYAWYKSPAVDGKWSHWNHVYLPNWEKNDKKVYPTGQHEPPEDIGSNYFPLLGCYSSRDPNTIHEHMKYLRQAGVGALIL